MSIRFKDNSFKLDTNSSTYLIKIIDAGYLMHQYYGPFIQSFDISSHLPIMERSFSPNPTDSSYTERELSLDTLPQEYSGNGTGDFRLSSIETEDENGFHTVDLRYHSHEIKKGCSDLPGLPSARDSLGDAQTLSILMKDEIIGLEVILNYTVFESGNFITRNAIIRNRGRLKLKLGKAMSLCMDFPGGEYDFIHLWGGWAMERQLSRQKVQHGLQGFYSKRGTSSHQHNPFFALCSPDTTEHRGNAYGFSFVYSGNHISQVEKSQFDSLRCIMGINPDGFEWSLSGGESFTTPQVVMAFSSEGLNGMSQIFHNVVRKHITRGPWVGKRRPILINNWEATYFDFNEEKILDIARTASGLGIEMMVLDDGWFGKRNNDDSSLGDWYVDKVKLPSGLGALSDRLKEIGMQFGLWFEPEMLSQESELYKAHPDWFLQQPKRRPSTGRNQLVLDFSRIEVRDAIWKQMDLILKECDISYIKWDMNRHLTEVGTRLGDGARQGEVYHRYVLGVYDVMDRLNINYPEILLENCSGGGGRFDMGALYYSPQIWCSDNSDAVERTKIQYGSSLCYPISSMGAHISAIPNHQLNRSTPFKSRGDVAMWGAFGYELDLSTITEDEKDLVRRQCAFVKEYGQTLHSGTFYRLISPFGSRTAAWAVESEDKKDLFVFYMQILDVPNGPHVLLPLPFLEGDQNYRNTENDDIYHASVLKNVGIPIPWESGDYLSFFFHYKALA